MAQASVFKACWTSRICRLIHATHTPSAPPSHTLQDIGSSSRASTVFLPHGPGSVGEAATAIRNGVLSGMAGSPPPPADPMQR